MNDKAYLEKITQKFLTKHQNKKPSKKMRNRPFKNNEPRRHWKVVDGSFENGKKQ